MKNLGAVARRSGAGSALFALLALVCVPLFVLPANAQSEMRVRFSLDRAIDGVMAPLFVAIDSGYFKEEGLEVVVEPASSPMEAITRLANAANANESAYDMSFGDLSQLIRYRDQNPSSGIEAVFIVHDKPAHALIGRKSRGIQFVKDVENRKVAAPAAEPASQLWPVFASRNAIDTQKVALLNVGLQVRAPMLVSGEVDALFGNSFSAIDLKDRGVQADDIVVLLMADYGVQVYGSAILAGAKFQTERPEAVRAFLRAYARGVRDTLQNPERAIEPVLKRMQGARKEIELERLKIAIAQNIKKIDPKAETIGAADPERLKTSFEQIGKIYTFKTKLKPEDVFDGQYLPAPPKPETPAKPQKKRK